jgi:hypothetical protein
MFFKTAKRNTKNENRKGKKEIIRKFFVKPGRPLPTWSAYMARLVACSYFLHHWRSGKKPPARPRRAMGHKSHAVWWLAHRFFGTVEIWALPVW